MYGKAISHKKYLISNIHTIRKVKNLLFSPIQTILSIAMILRIRNGGIMV